MMSRSPVRVPAGAPLIAAALAAALGGAGAAAAQSITNFGGPTLPPVVHVPPPVIVPTIPGGFGGGGIRVDMGTPTGGCTSGRTSAGGVQDGCQPRPRRTTTQTSTTPAGTGQAGPPPPPPRTAPQPTPPLRFTLPPGEQRLVPNEVLVQIGNDVPAATLEAIERRLRLTRLSVVPLTLVGVTLYHYRLAPGDQLRTVLAALSRDQRIAFAQPNFRFATPKTTFRLASAGNQSAPVDASLQYAVQSLRLEQAHQVARGEAVIVAVIDSAIDTSHPEFGGGIRKAIDVTGLGTAAAGHDHGTAMAGAIAAHVRLLGAAPAAALIGITAFRPEGEGANGTTLTVLRALAAARGRGLILVAAAGNAGPKSPPLFPAADPNVIAVTAIDADDKVFGEANRGGHVAVASPGVDVLVPGAGGSYEFTSGTSVATAHVSGVIALMLQRDPLLDADGVRKLLAQTARDLGPRGRDDQFGAGATDAYAAIQAVTPRTPAVPVVPAAAAAIPTAAR